MNQVAEKIANLIIREGLDYNQTKVVFKAARRKAGLKPTKGKKGTVVRLTASEKLAFIDQAYREGGRTGLMMQTLLETGCRVSEFVEIRIEDIDFAERYTHNRYFLCKCPSVFHALCKRRIWIVSWPYLYTSCRNSVTTVSIHRGG